MILYFTGTGNSRYLARRMAEALHEEAVDATALIRAGEHPVLSSETPYVFVAPTYAWRLPRVFRDWIRQCRLTGSRAVYFVLTCGDGIGDAARYLRRFCWKLGMEYRGTAPVVMPENYLVMFEPTPEGEDADLFRAAEAQVDGLCSQILAGEPFDPVKTGLVGRLESGIVNRSFYTFYIGARKFRSTDACMGCGRCVQVCPLNNIRLQDGRPEWGRDCTHCMACICRCPAEAIEYGKKTRGRRRYVCQAEGKEDRT